jgi:hypothetical protein
VLLHGAAELAVGGGALVQLTTGDLVVLPHGDGHTTTDPPGSPVRPLTAILSRDSSARNIPGRDTRTGAAAW